MIKGNNHHQVMERSTNKTKSNLRNTGIEPVAQEWESCMLPLHQLRIQRILFEEKNHH